MNPVIIALDYPSAEQAINFVSKIKHEQCIFKVGNELFTAGGVALVEALVKRNFKVFLDLKYHDIPNTVASACRSAAKLGIWMINVHASGGTAMMSAARKALEDFGADRPLLVAVTVLTSMDEQSFRDTALPSNSLKEQVLHLSSLAYQSGLDGVVCSALEAAAIKEATQKNFVTVTPGIRLSENCTNDQQRVMTPRQAIQNGADYLVIGRPITQATDPELVIRRIYQQLDNTH